MKTRTQIATTRAPDGSTLVLYRHQDGFIITVNQNDLMVSRAHWSEIELARLGCAHTARHQTPRVLIGGLGMGYTLRQTLDLLGSRAMVVVAELLPEIVRWNQDYLGELNNHPLRDPRVVLKIDDVASVIQHSTGVFDTILLDVDNGPEAITNVNNNRLYDQEGIRGCFKALKPKGCLAVWSCYHDTAFESRLRKEDLHVDCVPVAAHKGARSRHCCIWLASRDPRSINQPAALNFGREQAPK